MIPYIFLNLGFPFGGRKKVFMGDAGSMLIGFTVIWVLLQGTQGSKAQMTPVTALWLIAIPLMDMTCIMIRRIRKGVSPFKPDREHLHHICLRAGLSSHQALVVICGVATLLAVAGIALEYGGVFVLMFFLYYQLLNNIWRILAKLRPKTINESR